VSVVQALLSSHCAALVQQFAIGVFTQPVEVLQESDVHTLPSSQLIGVCPHVLLTHVSVVQALLSSHDGGTVAVCVQALFVQPSVVQMLLSLHEAGTIAVCVQVLLPTTHCSEVQMLLSVHKVLIWA
jgi:hypothetical protein